MENKLTGVLFLRMGYFNALAQVNTDRHAVRDMWSGFWNSFYGVHLTVKKIIPMDPEVLRGSPKFSGVLRGSLRFAEPVRTPGSARGFTIDLLYNNYYIIIFVSA